MSQVSSHVSSLFYLDAMITRHQGCDTVEKFEKFLADEEKFWKSCSFGKSQVWESMKNFMLWYSFLVEKKIDHTSLLLEQPGFDVNAKFVCWCEGIQEVLESILEGSHQMRQTCMNSLCTAKLSPINLPFMTEQWSDGNFELLKRLLSVPGVDVNARGPGGKTPIMEAIGSYRVDAIKLLAGVDKVDLEHTIDWVKTQFGGDPKKHILKFLEDACLARTRMGKVGLGKGRNARRRKNKEKQSQRSNEEKVVEKDKSVDERESESEKLRMKLSLLEKEKEEEKEKINLMLKNETEAILALEAQVKITELENVSLEEEMKEIESALDALLKRKSRIAEKQKSNELKFAEMEKQQTTLKQTVAAKKAESETKIARIEEEIEASKKTTEKKEVGGNRELENFLEGQILELEVELECPVCLEVATTSPIYKCLDDHLLCRLQEEKLY